MNATQLTEFLTFSIKNRFPVLITGKPGIGKSDITDQATKAAGAHLIISHPVVSDPTDYKGLPFAGTDGSAHFMPFGELNALIHATEPTVFFLDDLGQAPASVQAACMQLILARRINGHKVSDQVTFLAATNRREDKAAVTGILEPVKSRFATIIPLEVSTDDWVKWALQNNMPTELIAFIRFRPELLENFKPTKDIQNSPSPRTVASVGKLQNAGLSPAIEFEVIKGAAGEAFAAEYTGFLKLYRNLPNIDAIILNPDKSEIPNEPAILYALTGALGARMNAQTIAPIVRYLDRLPAEISVCTMKDAVTRKGPEIASTRAFIDWSMKNKDVTGL